ncbi:hypothetical protein AB4Z46_13285 [Variovorax sp. M-6]
MRWTRSHEPSLWRSLGAYDPNDADAAARGAAAAQWRQWITARCP